MKTVAVPVLELQTNTFSIYPNPSKGSFVIESNEEIDEITIFNTLGKIVLNIDSLR